MEACRCEKLAAIPQADFEARVAAFRDAGKAVTAEDLLKTKAHLAHNTGETEWYTPQDIFEAARGCVGGCVPRSGSEQSGRRAVVIVSHDGFNRVSAWRSIIVVPLSTLPRQRRAGAGATMMRALTDAELPVPGMLRRSLR